MKKILILIGLISNISTFATSLMTWDVIKNHDVRLSISNDIVRVSSGDFVTVSNTVTEQTESPCRICCTLTAQSQWGTYVEVSACAGWLFTSCEDAGAKACQKAIQGVLELMESPD